MKKADWISEQTVNISKIRKEAKAKKDEKGTL